MRVGVSTWQRSPHTYLASQVDGHTHTGSHSGIHALRVTAAGEDGQALITLRAACQKTLVNIVIHVVSQFSICKTFS